MLAGFEGHAGPILASAAASADAEVRAVALFFRGLLRALADAASGAEAGAEAAGASAEAMALLRQARDAAETAEYALLNYNHRALNYNQARDAAETAEYAAAAVDRWVGPFAGIELALLQMRRGELGEAKATLGRAAAVPPKTYSFHTWHQAAMRKSRAMLKELKAAQGRASGGAAAAGREEAEAEAEEEEEEEEAGHEETEEIAKLRRQIETEERDRSREGTE